VAQRIEIRHDFDRGRGRRWPAALAQTSPPARLPRPTAAQPPTTCGTNTRVSTQECDDAARSSPATPHSHATGPQGAIRGAIGLLTIVNPPIGSINDRQLALKTVFVGRLVRRDKPAGSRG